MSSVEQPGRDDDPADGLPGAVRVEPAADVTRIVLVGEVDLVLRSDLQAVAADAAARGRPVEVDLSDVSFMDSTGVGFLVSLARAGQANGWRPLLRGANRRVRDTIDLSGIAALVEVPPEP